MLYYTLSQGWEFAAMAAAGAAMGAVALAFSALRHVMCVGIWGCLVCDCLMGLAWAAVACPALVAACRGDARAYHFLAMIAGAALFSAAVSPPARASAARMRRGFGALRARLAASRLVRVLFK